MKKVLVVLAILLLAVSVQAQNLVYNGDFSINYAGYAIGWSTAKAGWGKMPDFKVGNNGVHLAHLESASNAPFLFVSDGSEGNFCAWAYQEVSVEVGKTYDFSAMYTGGVSSGMAWWEIGLYAGGHNAGKINDATPDMVVAKTDTNGDYFEVGGDPGSFWKTAATTFEATSSIYTVYLKVGRINEWTPFGAAFDNVSITEVVPEPSSILALGAGLMGMAGFVVRRRK